MGVLQLISKTECNKKRRTQVMSHGLHDTSFSQESGGTYTFLQPSLKIHIQNMQYSEPATQFSNRYSQQPSVFSLKLTKTHQGRHLLQITPKPALISAFNICNKNLNYGYNLLLVCIIFCLELNMFFHMLFHFLCL
jgi:hypothetical protein